MHQGRLNGLNVSALFESFALTLRVLIIPDPCHGNYALSRQHPSSAITNYVFGGSDGQSAVDRRYTATRELYFTHKASSLHHFFSFVDCPPIT